MLLGRDHLRKYVMRSDDPEHIAPLPVATAAGATEYRVGRHGVDLAALFPDFAPDTTYLVDSIGHWSLHELIAYCLSRIGPADMWLTSWGITAEPLKVIISLLETGAIRDLSCLFDSRVKLQCPQAYQLLVAQEQGRKLRVHLGKNHSKTVVLLNDSHAVTIVTSANLTINPRIEGYVVLTHRHVAISKRDVIDLVMSGAQPFDAE